MLVCTRGYAAYPLSFRHLEEMMQERGVFVDHSTVHRWALKILPVMALIFFVAEKERLDQAGGRMEHTSEWRASGSIYAAPSIATATRWISCSPPSGTSQRLLWCLIDASRRINLTSGGQEPTRVTFFHLSRDTVNHVAHVAAQRKLTGAQRL